MAAAGRDLSYVFPLEARYERGLLHQVGVSKAKLEHTHKAITVLLMINLQMVEG